MNFNWVQLGSIYMFLSVVLGAFGSHALREKISEHALDIYNTGVLYHFIHGLALFIVAWLATTSLDPKIQYAGVCFMLGVVIFSGSLYILSITDMRWLGMITPIGGLLFLLGWVLLFYSQFQNPV